MKFGTKDNRLVHRARSLRVDSTKVEQKLWYRLRNRQLDGYKFRRQHPIAGYVLDFACEELRLGVERDGGQHNEAHGLATDAPRTARLQAQGWHMLRFWNNDVWENIEGVLTVISETLARLSPCPSPGFSNVSLKG